MTRRGFEDARACTLTAGAISMCLLLEALAAYSWALPLPLFGYALAICLAPLLATSAHLRLPPTSVTFLCLFTLATVVTIFKVATKDYGDEMPAASSLPYFAFLFVRFFLMLGFFSMLVVSYTVASRIGSEVIVRYVFIVSIVVSIFAIYIYLAQTNGLWEPSRTRAGTGGQDYRIQAVRFSYGFHRALGTFREPSHLAQWLVGPFVMAALHRAVPLASRSLAMATLILTGAAILLTGSLLGYLAVAACLALMVALHPSGTLRAVAARSPLLLGGVLVLVIQGVQQNILYTTLNSRFSVLIDGGVAATNRAEMWTYLTTQVPPILGYGIGNSNILLSKFNGSSLMSSHLSLFSNYYFSTGILGLGMVAWIMLAPIVQVAAMGLRQRASLLPFLLPCAAWLVNYSGDAEEFRLMHSVLLGLFWASAREFGGAKVSRPAPKGRSRRMPAQLRRPRW